MMGLARLAIKVSPWSFRSELKDSFNRTTISVPLGTVTGSAAEEVAWTVGWAVAALLGQTLALGTPVFEFATSVLVGTGTCDPAVVEVTTEGVTLTEAEFAGTESTGAEFV
jgi:hypothetical protein